MAARACRVDALGRFARNAVVLLVRRLMILEAGDARVQKDRGDLHATRHEARHQRRRERPRGRRHLCRSGLRREDGLIGRGWPGLRDVAVPDRTTVSLEVLWNWFGRA